MSTEVRYEVIVREHRLERGTSGDKPSTKSRRYDIYKRVFQKAHSGEVISSIEAVLNKDLPY